MNFKLPRANSEVVEHTAFCLGTLLTLAIVNVLIPEALPLRLFLPFASGCVHHRWEYYTVGKRWERECSVCHRVETWLKPVRRKRVRIEGSWW